MNLLALISVAAGVAVAQPALTSVQTRQTVTAVDDRLADHPKSKTAAVTGKKAAVTSVERVAPLRTPVPSLTVHAKVTKGRSPK
jgi:hypothetical protein